MSTSRYSMRFRHNGFPHQPDDIRPANTATGSSLLFTIKQERALVARGVRANFVGIAQSAFTAFLRTCCKLLLSLLVRCSDIRLVNSK